MLRRRIHAARRITARQKASGRDERRVRKVSLGGRSHGDASTESVRGKHDCDLPGAAFIAAGGYRGGG